MSENQNIKLEYQFIGEDVNLSSQIDKINNRVEALGEEFDETSKAIENSGRRLREIGNLAEQAGNDFKKSGNGMKAFGKVSESMNAEIKELSSNMNTYKKLSREVQKEQGKLQTRMKNMKPNASDADKKALERDLDRQFLKISKLKKMEDNLKTGFKGMQTYGDVLNESIKFDKDNGGEFQDFFKAKEKNYKNAEKKFAKDIAENSKRTQAIIENQPAFNNMVDDWERKTGSRTIGGNYLDIDTDKERTRKEKKTVLEKYNKELQNEIDNNKKLIDTIQNQSAVKSSSNGIEDNTKALKTHQKELEGTINKQNELNDTLNDKNVSKSSKKKSKSDKKDTNSDINSLEKEYELIKKINDESTKNQKSLNKQSHKNNIDTINTVADADMRVDNAHYENLSRLEEQIHDNKKKNLKAQQQLNTSKEKEKRITSGIYAEEQRQSEVLKSDLKMKETTHKVDEGIRQHQKKQDINFETHKQKSQYNDERKEERKKKQEEEKKANDKVKLNRQSLEKMLADGDKYTKERDRQIQAGIDEFITPEEIERNRVKEANARQDIENAKKQKRIAELNEKNNQAILKDQLIARDEAEKLAKEQKAIEEKESRDKIRADEKKAKEEKKAREKEEKQKEQERKANLKAQEAQAREEQKQKDAEIKAQQLMSDEKAKQWQKSVDDENKATEKQRKDKLKEMQLAIKDETKAEDTSKKIMEKLNKNKDKYDKRNLDYTNNTDKSNMFDKELDNLSKQEVITQKELDKFNKNIKDKKTKAGKDTIDLQAMNKENNEYIEMLKERQKLLNDTGSVNSAKGKAEFDAITKAINENRDALVRAQKANDDYHRSLNNNRDNLKKIDTKDKVDTTRDDRLIKEREKLVASTKQLISSNKSLDNSFQQSSIKIKNNMADVEGLQHSLDKLARQGKITEDDIVSLSNSMIKKKNALESTKISMESYNNSMLENIQKSKLVEGAIEGQIADLQRIQSELLDTGADFDKLGRNVNDLEGEIKGLEGDLEGLRTSIKAVGSSCDIAINNLEQLGNATKQAGNSTETLSNKFDSMGNKIVGASEKIKTASNNIKNAFSGLQNAGRGITNMGQGIMNLGQQMQWLSYTIAGAFGATMKVGMDYDREMANVGATLNTSGKSATYFAESMEKIDAKVREVSSQSIFSPSQIAESAKYISLAGYDLDKMLASIKPMADLMALTGIEDVALGVDLLTDSFASLGKGMQQADEGAGAFTKRFDGEMSNYMDTMAKLQSISNQTVQQGMEAMIYAGGEFSRLNIPLNEAGALLGTLASRGLKSAEAGRGLASIMINLTKETGQSAEALKELNELTGVDVFGKFTKNADGKMEYKLEEQLQAIDKAFAVLDTKYGPEKGAEIQNRIMGGIGGKTQIKTFAKLMDGMRNEYNTLKNELSEDNVFGAMDSMLDTKKDSIDYKFKMMVASIQESMVSMFKVLEPYIEKVIEIVTEMSDAFRKMTDEEKLGVAKFAGLLAVLPLLIVGFGFLISVLGSLVTIIGSVGSGMMTLIGIIASVTGSLGTLLATAGALFKGLVNGNFINTFIGLFPRISEAIFKVISSLSTIKGVITTVMAGFGESITAGLSALGTAVKTYIAPVVLAGMKVVGIVMLIVGAFRVLKDTLSNMGDLGFFNSLGQALANLVNDVIDGVSKIVSIFNKDWGSWIDDNVEFVTSNDKKAKDEGYNSYKDKKRQEKNEEFKNSISNIVDETKSGLGDLASGFGNDILTGIDGFSNGALSSFKKLREEGKTITFTDENIGDYKQDIASVIKMSETLDSKRKSIAKSTKKEVELTEQLSKKRKEMESALNKNGKDSKKYKDLSAEYDKLKQDRKLEIDMKIKNKEEIEKIQAKFDEDKKEIEVLYEIAVKEGKEEEFIYSNLGEEFYAETGMELTYVNKDKAISDIEEVKSKLPTKEELEAELNITEPGTEAFTDVTNKILALEDLEPTIDVAMEIVNETEVAKQYNESGLEELRLEVEKTQEALDKLEPNTDAYNKTKEHLEAQKKAYAEYESFLKGHQEKLKELMEGDSGQFATNLIKAMTEGYTAQDIYNALFGDNPSQEFFDYLFGDGSVVLPEIEVPEPPKKEAPKDTTQKNTIETEWINANDPTGMLEGVENKVNGVNQKWEENAEVVARAEEGMKNYCAVEPEVPDLDVEGFEGISEAVKNSGTDVEELTSKAQELSGQLSEISAGDMTTSFAILLEICNQIRQKFIDIGDVANNYTKEMFSGSADGLLEKLEQVRQKVIDIGDVANNYMREMLTTALDGLLEKLATLPEMISSALTMPDTSGFAVMVEPLQSGLAQAREALIGLCGVALNTGVGALTTMSQAMKGGLAEARATLLSICNVAYNRGVGAMSSMASALTSGLQSALSIAREVASAIDGAVRKANNIKIPTIPSGGGGGERFSMGWASASPMSGMIPANNVSTVNSSSISNSSNFNFNIDRVVTNNNADLRSNASKLTTYCRRKGLF